MSKQNTSSGLRRSLGIADVVLITVSGVTPASSIFVIAPFAIHGAGTGAFLSFVLAAILAVTYALCYAELGAAHPNAGGEYVIVQRLFGRLACLQMYLFVLCLLLFIPAVLATGAATYLNSALGTQFDSASVALVVVVLCYAIGILDIKLNALVTGLFLGVEVLVLALIAVLGFGQQHQSAALLLHPVMADSHGVLATVSVPVIAAMIGSAMFSYNGFGGAIYLAEDMHERHQGGKAMARAVLISLGIVVLVELLPMTALLLGAPSLTELARQADPISYVVSSLSSPLLARAVSGGIFLSVFNAIIAIVLQSSRFLYASGRDGMWPARMNEALLRIHPRFGTPWIATLLFAVPSALLTFNSNLADLTSFTVILILLSYLGMGIAALVSRRRSDIHHPYTMSWWPLPVLLAIGGTLYTLWAILQDAPLRDFLIVAAIIVVGLLFGRWQERAQQPATSTR
ncbi:APC family permease [Vogesella sp. LIG4]|uniref:APC family permease n=1 Tax=Vogesella sp. LIG4 TaxID=1192162 RepID=UPI00081FDBF8|nr:APC family permease [Vogesella sp. LIG4]SCK09945.1 Amino acid transporter [Vogesella sp. LIG4]